MQKQYLDENIHLILVILTWSQTICCLFKKNYSAGLTVVYICFPTERLCAKDEEVWLLSRLKTNAISTILEVLY